MNLEERIKYERFLILVIMKSNIVNGVYIFEGSTVVGTVSSANTYLWHIRLGHISERWLNKLVKQELLCGDKVHKICSFRSVGASKDSYNGRCKVLYVCN